MASLGGTDGNWGHYAESSISIGCFISGQGVSYWGHYDVHRLA
jgi:hypothetical protein